MLKDIGKNSEIWYEYLILEEEWIGNHIRVGGILSIQAYLK